MKYRISGAALLVGLAMCLCPSFLTAQHPSASYRTAKSPMLGELVGHELPAYNPALLALGIDPLREDLPRRFHLRFLDMMSSYRLLSEIFVTDTPSFEQALSSRMPELGAGLSVTFTDLSSRSQMYREALLSYYQDRKEIDVAEVVATLKKPGLGSLSRAEIELAPAFKKYKERLEGDARILLKNTGKIIGGIGIEYLQDQSFFHSQAYAQLFDIEFLLGRQAALGLGVNVRDHIDVADDFSGFHVDTGRLTLPVMNMNIPNWQAGFLGTETNLTAVIFLATANYIDRLTHSLSAEQLGILVLRSMFEQSFINLYHVVEPNLRFSFGVPVNQWLYLGSRLKGHLLWGLDNLMIDPDALDLSEPIKLAQFMYSPVNYQLGVHASWDLSLLAQPLDWLSLSLMVSDVVGIAPSEQNASQDYWGDPYYPIDLQLGSFAQFPLDHGLQIGFGADVYEIISMLAKRPQRFNPSRELEFVDRLRFKFELDYMEQFRLMLHYWHQAFGLELQLDFLTFHPSVGVDINFDLSDIRVNLNILNFTN